VNTRRPATAAGQSWRKWGAERRPVLVSNPHVPLAPDPLSADDLWTDGFFAGYERALADGYGRRSPLVGFVLAAIAGAIVGALLTVAAVTLR